MTQFTINISNLDEFKQEFNEVNHPIYKNYEDILVELKTDIIAAVQNNTIIIAPIAGYHQDNLNTGYAIFGLQEVKNIDGQMVLTYSFDTTVGAS